MFWRTTQLQATFQETNNTTMDEQEHTQSTRVRTSMDVYREEYTCTHGLPGMSYSSYRLEEVLVRVHVL